MTEPLPSKRFAAAKTVEIASYGLRGVTRSLQILEAPFTDLSCLRDWSRLVSLSVDLGRLRSVEGIQHLNNLRRLHIGLGWNRRSLFELSALSRASSLEELLIGIADPVSDLSPISDLPRLKLLSMFFRDADTARRLFEVNFDKLGRLEELRWWCKGDNSGAIPSLRPLRQAVKLKRLSVGRVVVEDRNLSALFDMAELEEVELTGELDDAQASQFIRERPQVELRIQKLFRPAPADLEVGIVRANFFPDEGDGPFWSIFQDLSVQLGVRSNYGAEKKIRAAIEREDPALLARLDFDSEADYACVRAASKDDIMEVAKLINKIAEAH